MRALHTLRGGKLELYIGPRPRGPRGGTSGNPVDARLAATGEAAEMLYWILLPDELILQVSDQLSRPIQGTDLLVLELFKNGADAVRAALSSGRIPSLAGKYGKLEDRKLPAKCDVLGKNDYGYFYHQYALTPGIRKTQDKPLYDFFAPQDNYLIAGHIATLNNVRFGRYWEVAYGLLGCFYEERYNVLAWEKKPDMLTDRIRNLTGLVIQWDGKTRIRFDRYGNLEAA